MARRLPQLVAVASSPALLAARCSLHRHTLMRPPHANHLCVGFEPLHSNVGRFPARSHEGLADDFVVAGFVGKPVAKLQVQLLISLTVATSPSLTLAKPLEPLP